MKRTMLSLAVIAAGVLGAEVSSSAQSAGTPTSQPAVTEAPSTGGTTGSTGSTGNSGDARNTRNRNGRNNNGGNTGNGNTRSGFSFLPGGGNSGRNGGNSASSGISAAGTPNKLPPGVSILPGDDSVLATKSMFSSQRVYDFSPPPVRVVSTRPVNVTPVAPPAPPLPVLRGTSLPAGKDEKAIALIEFPEAESQLLHVGDLVEGNKGGKITVIEDWGIEIKGDDGVARRVTLGQDIAGVDVAATSSSSSSSASTATTSLPPAASSKEEEMRLRRQRENNR